MFSRVTLQYRKKKEFFPLPGLGVVVVGFLLQFGGHPINPGKQEHLATPLLSSHLENKPHGEGAHGSKTYKLKFMGRYISCRSSKVY